ncbi:MAG: UDP-glucose 4-epimerase GalE [Bryobacterales bacterium]|nr:UDP-glucose 4-epimerase GalE [Bryobacterales bacterium]
MRVLVTGGAGFVGSVVTQQCVRAGHEVTVLDNLVQGHREAVTEGAELVVGDTGDGALVREVLASRRIEAVCHLAAYTIVPQSMREPGLYYNQNFVRSLNLLDAMVETGVKRFVFSSTAAVFGEPVRIPIDETHPHDPINPYGEAKLMFERVLARYGQIHGVRHAMFRYFNACGASGELGEDHNPETHIIPLIFRAAVGQTGPFQIFGDDYATPDGTAIRDYVHVIDLARAHLMALERLDTLESQAFNLGSGEGISVRELINATSRIIGRETPCVVRPRREGDPKVLRAASDRARQVLGWEPVHSSVEEIIGSAWAWFERHPRGYRS